MNEKLLRVVYQKIYIFIKERENKSHKIEIIFNKKIFF